MRMSEAIYPAPLHPEGQRDHPEGCPKCGLALEPGAVTPAVSNPLRLRHAKS